MKNRILVGAFLLVITSLTTQAQSTASGSSNTGTPTSGATPAQNGSTGATVSGTKAGSGTMSQGGAKSSGRKMKRTSKASKSSSLSSTGR